MLPVIGAATAAAAGPVEVRVEKRIAAPPERVLAVLADFEAWDHVFDTVRLVHTERQTADHARLRQVTHQSGRTLVYTVDATVDRAARRVDLTLDPSEPHDVALLHSTWRVVPHPGGGSRVELRIAMQTGLPVPEILERLAVERGARRSVDELARALERERTVAALQGMDFVRLRLTARRPTLGSAS